MRTNLPAEHAVGYFARDATTTVESARKFQQLHSKTNNILNPSARIGVEMKLSRIFAAQAMAGKVNVNTDPLPN
jgi:hypothetical protein